MRERVAVQGRGEGSRPPLSKLANPPRCLRDPSPGRLRRPPSPSLGRGFGKIEPMTLNDVLVRRARADEAEALTELTMRAKASWGYDAAFMAACREELTLTPETFAAWTVWA